MTVELNIPSQETINQPVVITTNAMNIVGSFFDFVNTKIHIFVEFGNKDANGVFTLVNKKHLVVSGAYYNAKISALTAGGAISSEFLTMLSAAVNDIFTTPGLHDQLIASGELVEDWMEEELGRFIVQTP